MTIRGMQTVPKLTALEKLPGEFNMVKWWGFGGDCGLRYCGGNCDGDCGLGRIFGGGADEERGYSEVTV